MNAIRVGFQYRLELTLQLILATCYKSPQILQSANIRIRVEYQFPKIDVVISAAFEVALKGYKPVSIVKVFVDFAGLADFLLIHLAHLLLDLLEVIGLIESVNKITVPVFHHLTYGINCLQRILDTVVIEKY